MSPTKNVISPTNETQGFTQTQQDEDDFNAQGRTTRKKREEKERVQIVLRGKEATQLYLQCYQLILWKQCHWLVSVKGFPEELETVVRDLWGLRIRLLHGDKDDEGGYRSGGTLGFSSTSEGENTDTDGGMSRSSRWSRRSGGKGREMLPKLIETLALCYLGMVLLRLPVSLGEIFKWVTTDEMIFTRAVRICNLPPYVSSLMTDLDQGDSKGDASSASAVISYSI